VVFHFGMTGWMKYFKDPEKDTPHDRVLITFSNGYHLAYDSQRKLGRIELTGDAESFIEDRNLGPDALTEVGLKAFRQLLGGKKSAIKSALMDQRTIAGLGNVYSDEILFQAGVHSRARPGRLGDEGIKKVFGKMGYVLEKAVEFRAEPGKFPQSRITPHRGKEGECPRCRGKINRTKVSGRTAYFCGNCQKTLA
jgi:formamidopyrimidine-DNA glycosylase